jgi:protein-disulfide isomerase-like protein with CxxC motif
MASVEQDTLLSHLPRMSAPWRVPAPTDSSIRVTVTHVTDPLCPWAYSFEPAMRALESRYGDQLEVRTVVIGLVTDAEQLAARGFTPERGALSALHFRQFGMPFTPYVRDRLIASAPACRLVKAVALQGEEFVEATMRALRLALFNTPLLLDEDDALESLCESIDGLDVARAISDLHSPAVEEAYQADFEEARSASKIAVALNRTANSDGRDRYTAPSLVLRGPSGGTSIVPGFQPFEAADVAIMNLEPGLRRLPVPDLQELLDLYPGGLTSQEVARVLAETTTPPDRAAAETELTHLVATGSARRTPVGDDALWTSA